MAYRAQKPFSKATLYSSAVIFILFGAMGFISIPAFSVLFLKSSWEGAGEATLSASWSEPVRDTRRLKATESRRPTRRPAKRGAVTLATGRTESLGSNETGFQFESYYPYLP